MCPASELCRVDNGLQAAGTNAVQVCLAVKASAAAAEAPGDVNELLALMQRLGYIGTEGHKKLYTSALDVDTLSRIETAELGASMQRCDFYGWGAGAERDARRCRLLALLHYAPRVTVLDVSLCELDGASAAALAASLSHMPQLQVCGPGTDDAHHVRSGRV